MGRKPNATILQFFRRGAKLADNSNRYPHTCKLCGEEFPKGRIDSLTNHITKPGKCPAISENERISACLALHGITDPTSTSVRRPAPRNGGTLGSDTAAAALPQTWSALEALAEASRQVDLNEKGENRGKPADSQVPAISSVVSLEDQSPIQYPLPEHPNGKETPAAENPPSTTTSTYDGRPQHDNQIGSVQPTNEFSASLANYFADVANGQAIQTPGGSAVATPEERLQALISPDEPSVDAAANISVAAAAAARLNPSLLDPQLTTDEVTSVATPPAPTSNHTPTSTATPTRLATPSTTATPPWGEISYQANQIHGIQVAHDPPQAPTLLQKGGVRMDTGDLSPGGRPRHARARFSAARRKEVQEVRKIGACIRCRILRKNCGKGDPCETCLKVLSPRVWRTGCVRTRLHDQLDLYSAGVHVVLAQNRYNYFKNEASIPIANNGTFVEASHFYETGHSVSVTVYETLATPSSSTDTPDPTQAHALSIMIDCDFEDVPSKVEDYMRKILPVFIENEPSEFMRVTLKAASEQLRLCDDELLRNALELWGLVEIIDREQQWTILEKRHADDTEPRLIRGTSDSVDRNVYSIMCLQLNAAAERKANTTSKNLLSGMQRVLQDSKVKVSFRAFLSALIFLNCVEKTTWAFKAWEQDHLRPGWPLEREPGSFTSQGANLANLLKMLLSIRKALPPTDRDLNGKLRSSTQETDEAIINFVNDIDLDYDLVLSRQEKYEFNPADSRSLELAFSSLLLLNAPASPQPPGL